MGLPLGQAWFVPGTIPGPSHGQPDQKVYVYVPFFCLKFSWEVLHGVGVDGVGGIFPFSLFFQIVFLRFFLLFFVFLCFSLFFLRFFLLF